MCVQRGFPPSFFFSDVDATSPGPDPVVTCKQTTTAEMLRDIYRLGKVISILFP